VNFKQYLSDYLAVTDDVVPIITKGNLDTEVSRVLDKLNEFKVMQCSGNGVSESGVMRNFD
jgi:hypothetical protein